MVASKAPNPRTALLQTYCLGLLKASRQWRQIADAELQSYGVSEATAYPLVFMMRLGDGSRQAALAEAIGIEGPSLVRLLDQLASAGLIERREDPSDKRAKTVHLTTRGQGLAAKLTSRLDEARLRVFANLDEADLRAALRVFAALDEAAAGGTDRREAAQ